MITYYKVYLYEGLKSNPHWLTQCASSTATTVTFTQVSSSCKICFPLSDDTHSGVTYTTRYFPANKFDDVSAFDVCAEPR